MKWKRCSLVYLQRGIVYESLADCLHGIQNPVCFSETGSLRVICSSVKEAVQAVSNSVMCSLLSWRSPDNALVLAEPLESLFANAHVRLLELGMIMRVDVVPAPLANMILVKMEFVHFRTFARGLIRYGTHSCQIVARMGTEFRLRSKVMR